MNLVAINITTMGKNNFNPDSVVANSGIYNKSFCRNGIWIDTDIIKAGIKYYKDVGKITTYTNCEKYNTMLINRKARLVARDLKEAGWEFNETLFFEEPVAAITLSVGILEY